MLNLNGQKYHTTSVMLKLNIIVAVCENLGIGIGGNLPWTLRNELQYFARTTKKTQDVNKKNVVIMGRKTYFAIPENRRPLAGRINIVLTRNPVPDAYPPDVILCSSLQMAMKRIEQDDLRSNIENIWVVGGSEVYKEAMSSPYFNRLYLTKIHKAFDCDTFFPEISEDLIEVPLESDMPSNVQEENGIKYEYKILQKCQ